MLKPFIHLSTWSQIKIDKIMIISKKCEKVLITLSVQIFAPTNFCANKFSRGFIFANWTSFAKINLVKIRKQPPHLLSQILTFFKPMHVIYQSMRNFMLISKMYTFISLSWIFNELQPFKVVKIFEKTGHQRKLVRGNCK